MKIELDKTGRGKWYFRIVATNGKVLAHSEEYQRKRNARQAAELIASSNFAGIAEVA